MPDDSDSQLESECPWDAENDDVAGASDLTLGTAEESYICPIEDVDHFRFTLPADQDLLKVDIAMRDDEPVSINPTYVIYNGTGDEVLAQPDSTESASMVSPLSIIHAAVPGDYVVQVHDSGKDAEDKRHPYVLTVTGMTDADDNEPNDGAESATALSGSTEGYLSYRGDEDWYEIAASARDILNVAITMPDGIAPAYRIVDADGNDIRERKNSDGLETVDNHEPLTESGTYYVIVYRDDGLSHDPEAAYSITLSLSSDPDPNEPNDTPADAVPLSSGAVTCGADWTTVTGDGYIASSGDSDWFVLDLADSTDAIVDLDVTFSGSLPEEFEAQVKLVFEMESNSCTQDQQCDLLDPPTCAEGDLDCLQRINACMGDDGFCNGANHCLPEGNCGVTLISRASAMLETSDPEYDPGAPVTPERVTVAAPLFGISKLYIAVLDYKGDALAIDNPYTLTVRVAKDTDANEPSEAYRNAPQLQDDSNAPHQAFAKPITIHDCTADNSNCCGTGATWERGAISYTFDQDWFQYDHPCPEGDCLLQIHYTVDGGPTDVLLSIHHVGGSTWTDAVTSVSDTGDQSAMSEIFGDDECFYAYHDHPGYYFSVRDTIFVSEGSENNGIWDWSREQSYSFCIAKYYEGCMAPCHYYEDNGDRDGCGPPQEEDE